MKGLTPYQNRLYSAAGIFECYECSHTWFSAYTWANTPQACLNCNIFVYPIHQWKLKRTKKEKKEKKEHIQDLCGKCRYQEKSCTFKKNY